MKKFAMLVAFILLLAGCNSNKNPVEDKTNDVVEHEAEVEETVTEDENNEVDTEEEAAVVEEKEKENENDGSTAAGKDNVEAGSEGSKSSNKQTKPSSATLDPNDVLSKSFFEELKKGVMPGSTVQLTHKAGDIKKILGQPKDEVSYEGAMLLIYDNYSYAVPYSYSDEDPLIYIAKIIKNDLTAKQIITAWGEPTEQGEMTNTAPGFYSYSYVFDTHVISFESQGGLDGKVYAIHLSNLVN